MSRYLNRENKCPVCQSYSENIPEPGRDPDTFRVECCRCGNFRITGTFAAMLSARRNDNSAPDRMANFSSHIRENQGQLFSEADMDFALQIPTPFVPERATNLLKFIAKAHPYAGESFKIPIDALAGQLDLVAEHSEECFDDNDHAMIECCNALFPYFAASWSRNAGKFHFLLRNYLWKTAGFVDHDERSRLTTMSAEGWKFLHSLEAPMAHSRLSVTSSFAEVLQQSMPSSIPRVDHNYRRWHSVHQRQGWNATPPQSEMILPTLRHQILVPGHDLTCN